MPVRFERHWPIGATTFPPTRLLLYATIDGMKAMGPLMQQIDQTVIKQGLIVPIAFMPSIVAYNKSRVGGNVVAPIGQCRSNLTGIYIKK